MKATLKLSLLLNFSLLVTLAGVGIHKPSPAPPPAGATLSSTDLPAAPLTASAPIVIIRTNSQPFHWRQLQSPVYQTYVQNLRQTGCPETTVRAIVTADVDARYAPRFAALEQKLADFDRSSWSQKLRLTDSRKLWLAELQALPELKTTEIASLLGTSAPASALTQGTSTRPDSVTPPDTSAYTPTTITTAIATAGASAASSAMEIATITSTSGSATTDQGNRIALPPVQAARRRHDSAQQTPTMPLVLQPVDLSPLNLNSDQLQAISYLREKFVSEVGGPNQSPDDPAYLERWLKAQTDVDALLHGMLGTYAWETYQAAVWKN